tara:strand:+ start:803 stop:1297 length:495 start_codon:yes stop_codon:yes gene_type:complete
MNNKFSKIGIKKNNTDNNHSIRNTNDEISISYKAKKTNKNTFYTLRFSKDLKDRLSKLKYILAVEHEVKFVFNDFYEETMHNVLKDLESGKAELTLKKYIVSQEKQNNEVRTAWCIDTILKNKISLKKLEIEKAHSIRFNVNKLFIENAEKLLKAYYKKYKIEN